MRTAPSAPAYRRPSGLRFISYPGTFLIRADLTLLAPTVQLAPLVQAYLMRLLPRFGASSPESVSF